MGSSIRNQGKVDAPKYKDYILSLIFLKRLSDVFEGELLKLSQRFGKDKAEQLIEADQDLVRFYLPKNTRWENVKKQATNIGEYNSCC